MELSRIGGEMTAASCNLPHAVETIEIQVRWQEGVHL